MIFSRTYVSVSLVMKQILEILGGKVNSYYLNSYQGVLWNLIGTGKVLEVSCQLGVYTDV